jgi:cation diffusion facilitator CzcD-associated flavoprotein CzcO
MAQHDPYSTLPKVKNIKNAWIYPSSNLYHGEMLLYRKILFGCLIFLDLSASLDELQERVNQDLDWTGYPENWVLSKEEALDVAIIGAGMAGTSAAFALKKLGIHHIRLFDQNPEKREGPWVTYAQMPILRTGKCATGPCLNFPSLTFQAWYEAQFGKDAWNALTKATPEQWMDYLYWFRKILGLPVTNNCRLAQIQPIHPNLFQLDFDEHGSKVQILARKVVLATGRGGFGGANIPSFVKNASPTLYAHTSQQIDYPALKDKHLIIIGCGSSAFDSAGAALEAGAKKVDILFRRQCIPKQNKFAFFVDAGVEQGFHLLPDDKRWQLTAAASRAGIPPPEEALSRVAPYPQLAIHPNAGILRVEQRGNQLCLITAQGTYSCDFLILATGYRINGQAQDELRILMPFISLWKEHISAPPDEITELGGFPYLGPSYEFTERERGKAPFLKNIHCFNYAALVSQGLTTNAIDSISIGAERLARGIAADFFAEQVDQFAQILDSDD